MYKGLLFDLDGVIVDTAKYHYLAWKHIADMLDIDFTPVHNERLKGVSRSRSLEIILEIGGISVAPQEQERLCNEKNEIYLDYIKKLTEEEVLPGVRLFMTKAREKNYKIALGTASKNSMTILEALKIKSLFDEIVDGNNVINAKPNPEVFIKGADALGLPYSSCIVFEDSIAGVLAAHSGGMKAVGIGEKEVLIEADVVIPGFEGILIEDLEARLIQSKLPYDAK
jgi:beta-phosphoglucomutase